MNFTESSFDIHFESKDQARKLAKKYGGTVRNDSYRLYGQAQVKQKTDVWAARIKPRSFAHKLEIVNKAKEMGSVKSPYKN